MSGLISTRKEYLIRGREMRIIRSVSTLLEILAVVWLILGHRTCLKDEGKYPFGDYIAYSNDTFTLTEVKHLWRQKGCVKKYGRRLVMRLDDFEKPAKSNVLCSNWKKWQEAIIWFQGTTDAVASQFFLKNVQPEMRAAAVELFGEQGSSASRANVFGELMMSPISPTKDVKDAVD
ncbi:unnamed protein product [Eruca vesicaria subsp. sativa]|uniref:Uncharacterized protein n=1 Tax=Eruca vesicaria subsp. sativa TaxID=29727 RepID=A0ABC8JBB1_ERUVS|nr:unnamed protein product [Eruca vesicaria subsp. sativa]